MSKQQDSHPIIILGYILSPPAGVVLTLLRIFTGSSQKNRTENTERVSDTTNERKTAPAPKSTRSGICVPALVLGILTGVFLLCGVMNIADGLFNNTFQAFLQGSYIPDSVMLGILSAAEAVLRARG